MFLVLDVGDCMSYQPECNSRSFASSELALVCQC